MFRNMLEATDENELFKMIIKGDKRATSQQRLQVLIEYAHKIVHQVIPLSILVYMNEHLNNPKLTKSFRNLAEASTSGTKRLFYYLLIFAQKPKEGLRQLKGVITPDSSVTEDFLICGFLRWYCHENKVEDAVLNSIVSILETVRLKYAKTIKGKERDEFPYQVDSFRADTKKELQSKHV